MIAAIWAILTTPQFWLAALLWVLCVAGYWALIRVGSRADAPDGERGT